MTDECIELKNIKYKSMLLNGNNEDVNETVENMSNLDSFLEVEKQQNFFEPWIKLNKTSKIMKFKEFVINYAEENKLSQEEQLDLSKFLITNLDRKRFLKTKEVNYNKDIGKIISIDSSFGFDIGKIDSNSRLFNINLAGGSILDVGLYPISFSRLIAGYVSGKKFLNPY